MSNSAKLKIADRTPARAIDGVRCGRTTWANARTGRHRRPGPPPRSPCDSDWSEARTRRKTSGSPFQAWARVTHSVAQPRSPRNAIGSGKSAAGQAELVEQAVIRVAEPQEAGGDGDRRNGPRQGHDRAERSRARRCGWLSRIASGTARTISTSDRAARDQDAVPEGRQEGRSGQPLEVRQADGPEGSSGGRLWTTT